MDTSEVRVETNSPDLKVRTGMAFSRLLLLCGHAFIVIPLLISPRFLSNELWSERAQTANPALGWALDIGCRLALLLAVCWSVPFSGCVVWEYFMGWKRAARWFQLAPEDLEIGYTRGPDEKVPLAEIASVSVQYPVEAAKPPAFITVRMHTGRNIKLDFIQAADAVEAFCAECGRRGLAVEQVTSFPWRTIVPLFATGPALILLVVLVRFALGW